MGGKGTLGVAVCGPGGMCDELREAVVQVCKSVGIMMDFHAEALRGCVDAISSTSIDQYLCMLHCHVLVASCTNDFQHKLCRLDFASSIPT